MATKTKTIDRMTSTLQVGTLQARRLKATKDATFDREVWVIHKEGEPFNAVAQVELFKPLTSKDWTYWSSTLSNATNRLGKKLAIARNSPPLADTYVYRIKSTDQSSNNLGPCEVCGDHCSEVFYQVEGKTYLNPESQEVAVTYHGCASFFGHEKCLISKRR